MSTDEIRETFLSFFEGKGHTRLPSASLVPAAFDASVLLTTAGMHPLKAYFAGQEEPPARRLTSAQKCFRTTDIENVGATARHLTFFEMLGNFSIGDYFKAGAVELAWDLTLNGFGFEAEDVWVTVFEGDEALGLGPDEEAIEAWRAIGVPSERIVPCPASENFWQSGPTGPCGPCSELYLDRGLAFGAPDDLPGGENERFLEFWNLVFMQLDQQVGADGGRTLTPLPQQNIDTGMGLNRMATILQGVETIFETDQFVPLIELGRSLATVTPEDRSLRILADHARAMTFLIADGVVPSNEDRGYILRRVMRRAVQHGRRLGIEGAFLPDYVEQVIATMGAGYPELAAGRATILKWVRAEEEGFGRTLESGLKLLEEHLAAGRLDAAAAFQLHDTYGFPFEMTVEIAGEQGVSVPEAGFTELMDAQRTRSAQGTRSAATGGAAELVRALGEPSTFTGYEHLEEHTVAHVGADADGRTLIKLDASPFYAAGGGQVADVGVLEADGAPLRVVDVLRAGDDQALVVDGEAPADGARVVARVDRAARHATAANHTATHLLQAALREALGEHVAQAGSYVGPDKLRFDFTHTAKLSEEERVALEAEVNARIVANDPVRAITTTLEEAKRLGAMALFGEKYGDVVRMVEVGDGSFSRELCGGTHVRSTAEIGVLKITSEGSSASNVRRIEAVTGPVALELLRAEDTLLREAAAALRTPPEGVPEAVAKLQQELKALRKGGGVTTATEGAEAAVAEVDGASIVTQALDGVSPKQLPDVADRLKGRHGERSAVVVGSSFEGKVGLVVAVSPALVERGVRAGAVVKVAAAVAGGGGGGRDTLASAGGRDVARLEDAISAGREAIEAALGAG